MSVWGQTGAQGMAGWRCSNIKWFLKLLGYDNA